MYTLSLARGLLFPSASRDHHCASPPGFEQSSLHSLASGILLFTRLDSHLKLMLLLSIYEHSNPRCPFLFPSFIINSQSSIPNLLVTFQVDVSPVWVSLEKSRYSRPPYVCILVIQVERRGCSPMISRTFMHYILRFFILSQATTIISCLVLESNHK